MDRLDALELTFSWEEAQDMLRPPPTIMPSIITIEDQTFEEYDVSYSDDVLVIYLNSLLFHLGFVFICCACSFCLKLSI